MEEEYACAACGGAFKIQHDCDESYYTVERCPFCGQDDLEVVGNE